MRDFEIEWHEELPSTNDVAVERARAGADRVVVAARRQTAGRGRRGNAWSSPAGAGLYASFVARPAVPASRSPLLTLLCGVAIHDALAPLVESPIGLKWPNDILAGPPHGGRKLAGILVESATSGETLDHAVFGVGVNLTRAEHADPEAAARAVSLEELGAAAVSPEGALSAVARTLTELLDRADRELEFVTAAWEARALGLGRTVVVTLADGRVTGELLGLAADGGLRLRENGRERVLHTGELDPAGLVPDAPAT